MTTTTTTTTIKHRLLHYKGQCKANHHKFTTFSTHLWLLVSFYPLDAVLERVIVVASCLSVWLAVTAGIVSKRKQLASWLLHHLLAHWYRSLERYDSSKNFQGVTLSEGDLWEWGGLERTIFCDFWTYKAPYLQNGARYDQGYYWTLIGNPIRTFDWYQDQWPWMTLNWPWAAMTRFLRDTCVFRRIGAHHENTNEHRPILSAAKM